MSLKFYTNPMSRGQIARWALHEAGAEYEQVVLEYGTTMKGPDYLEINPMGKVPAIVHDGQIVTEAAGICAYLAEAFPDAGLAPTAQERGAYYRWMFFAAGPVEAAVVNQNLGLIVPTDKSMMVGYGSFDATINTLDGHLANHLYVCGSRFTMADVYIGSQVDWGLQFNTLPQRDSFIAYAERMRARDAYQAAKAIDLELIAATAGEH